MKVNLVDFKFLFIFVVVMLGKEEFNSLIVYLWINVVLFGYGYGIVVVFYKGFVKELFLIWNL